jgi:Xaa-Pro aminopeptidase
MSINQVGNKFQLQKLIDAQAITKKIVQAAAGKVEVGMNEADGLALLNREFSRYGDIKFWHPHKFRIGKNTLCAFKEESDQEICLKANDHFFIDVGPVFFEHEGDYGETFIVGQNPEALRLKHISEQLFLEAKENFFQMHCSGKALYDFLAKRAEELDVNLNLKTLGHRVRFSSSFILSR